MRFAIVDGNKAEANPRQKGLCPCCSQPVISKCGHRKIWHWAHNSKINCDSWWEPETEWHRSWKNNYLVEWQEVTLFDDKTGEKHIADVKTAHGLVLEFQHSSINPKERMSREAFYKSMIWVVDGTRLKRDYPRFEKAILRGANQPGYFFVDVPEEVFPVAWLDSLVPVVFDFMGQASVGELQGERRKPLWCLLPRKSGWPSVVAALRREEFVKVTHERSALFPERQEEKSQAVKKKPSTQLIRPSPTHYFDPRKGRMVKKVRF